MTGPGGSDSFEYKDDSVVARISVDVPAASLTDLDQVRERTSAIRTEQEAIARASGDWIGYLQQIPQIAEQAAASYRNMITQLERISYIQNELGGLSNVGATGTAATGKTAPYSTAAPPNYVDPFSGMPGTGVQMGAGGHGSYMQSIMQGNPALFANMAAQRGNYVNPATLGFMGSAAAANANTGVGGSGGGQGWGAPPAGSSSTQATQKTRDSAAPPDQTQSGAPTTSEPQSVPADPHPDAPEWQKQLSSASSTMADIVNETRSGIKGKGMMGGAAALAGAIGSRFGGGDADGEGGGSKFGSVAKGVGAAGAGITAALGINKIIQGAGSQIQDYRNLGSVQGGGAAEGLGYEMQARAMAMNPFITLEQSRSIMQSALKNGYTGQEFDTVTGFMADNLKSMNMSATQSQQLFSTAVEKGRMSIKDLAEDMKNLKGMTGTPGDKIDQSTRNDQYQQTMNTLQSAGVTGDELSRATTSINEAFTGDRTLATVIPDEAKANLSNPAFLMTMATANGVQGAAAPEEVPTLMQDQGISIGKGYWAAMKFLAQQAQGSTGKNVTLGAQKFYSLCTSQGISVGDYSQSRRLYLSLINGDPNSQAFARHAEGEQKAAQGNGVGGEVSHQFRALNSGLDAGFAIGDLFRGNFTGAWDDVKNIGTDISTSYDAIKADFSGPQDISAQARAEAAQKSAPIGTGIQPGEPGYGTSSTVHGQVTGELRVTMDRDGQIHVPPTVQISGQQQGVNAGYGGGTMNNPSPGDPSFGHANTNFGDGK